MGGEPNPLVQGASRRPGALMLSIVTDTQKSDEFNTSSLTWMTGRHPKGSIWVLRVPIARSICPMFTALFRSCPPT